MKKIVLFLACAIVAFTSCTKSCQGEKSADAVLKIGTNANFPPYESINAKGELEGFDIDVGRALGEKLNRKVEFKEFDFDALLVALDKGQIDVILSGMSITESRQKEIAMVPYQGEPLTEISFLFWQNIPEGINGFADVKNKALERKLSVSVQSGHFLEDFLRGEGIPVKPLIGPPEQILDIKYNKSFSAAVDSTVGKKLSREHQGLKNVVLPLPKDKWDLGNGIGIKKSRTQLIEDVAQAIALMKTDGSLQKLVDKWLKDGQ